MEEINVDELVELSELQDKMETLIEEIKEHRQKEGEVKEDE